MQYDIDGGNITVIVGEEVRIDVPTTLNYIKSGQAEISAAVDAGIEAYNSNATDKTTAFNNNATDKTNAFNLNASNKTGDFNDNYTLKKAAVDASADAAAASATLAQQWAVKMDGKVADEDYSAKYYADLAAQSAGATGANTDLSNLTPTGEAKFTAKQDVISDLSDIRSGAALGATAVQPADLSSYALDNAVVHLAGTETITGEKTFTANPTIQKNRPLLFMKDNWCTRGTTPAEYQYQAVWMQDTNSDTLGGIIVSSETNGSINTALRTYKNIATETYSELKLYYPTSGDPYTSCPASDVANSIVTTVNKSKAANGYFQLGNGLIVQWGRTKVSVLTGASHTPVTTITLPKAFTTTNYSLTGTFESNTSTSASETDDVTFCTTSISTTSVQGFGYDAGGNTYDAYLRWVAIGY